MRIARALAAAVVLTATTVGLPFALATYGQLPTSSELADLPTRMLDDRTAFMLLTALAWITWATFVVNVVVEIAGEVTGKRRGRLTARVPLQSAARRLVTALTMTAALAGPLVTRVGTAPALASTEVTLVNPPSSVRLLTPANTPETTPHRTLRERTIAAANAAAAQGPRSPADHPTVTVMVGDTPWGIAEQHLGQGLRWRELWNLNRSVPQPDGRAWVTEDLIQPGWTLRLPADSIPARPSTPAVPTEADPPGTAPDPATPPTTGSERSAEPRAEETASDASGDDIACAPAAEATVTPQPSSPTTTRPTSGPTTSQPAPNSPRATDDRSEQGPDPFPALAGITGAAVTATGLALLVRRRRQRRAVLGARRLRPASQPEHRETEEAVAAASELPLVTWAGHHLASLLDNQGERLAGDPVAVEISADDGIEVLWDEPNPSAPLPWSASDGGWSWRLPYDADDPLLLNDQPAGIPGLVTIGTRNDRQLLIDLEAYGSISLSGDDQRVADLARAMTFELGSNDELASARVFLADLDMPGAERLPRIHLATTTAAINHLNGTATALSKAMMKSAATSSFDYRRHETWTDTTVAVAPTDSPEARALIDAAPARCGVAAIVVGHDDEAEATITVDEDGTGRIEPLGITFQAAALPATSTERITALLDAIDETTPASDGPDPLATTDDDRLALDRSNGDEPEPSEETDQSPEVHATPAGEISEPSHDEADSDDPEIVWPEIMVKVLGPPHVPSRPQLRRRELALVVYLTSKGKPTPASSVQHAVWGGQSVQTKTIWNVATATRAALGQLEDGTPAMPPSQRAHNTLGVAPEVRTDLQVLQDLYDAAQESSSSRAIDLLQQGLDLIEGQPFDSPDCEWAHHTELLVADANRLIEEATELLVDLAATAGRIDLARQAITQGLRALPGNEVLYRARMTLEHDQGNLAAVRAAYDELESFLADIDSEPSRSTIDLYRRLRPQRERHAS